MNFVLKDGNWPIKVNHIKNMQTDKPNHIGIIDMKKD